jgi:molybdenum cofactor cytidylyltransferase
VQEVHPPIRLFVFGTGSDNASLHFMAHSLGWQTLGVPALFTRSVFEELLLLADKAGAKSIVLRSRERVASLSFPEGQIDIDTWEDLERLDNGNQS